MKQKEKESYIQAMLYVAKIDGIKKEEELRVIRELAEKLNVENEILELVEEYQQFEKHVTEVLEI